MKRILCATMVAFGLLLTSSQQASAWSKFNFGVGLNVGWEGGGNSILWGVMKGGPSPGQMSDGAYPSYPGGLGAMPTAQMGNPGLYSAGYTPYAQSAPMMPMQQPAPMPPVQSMPQMPRASETQPVGYFTYPAYSQYPVYAPYPQYYWNYYGNWYGY
jgi:hypothetical protein